MSNLATEDMDRLTEIASFRNAESTGAINRDFAKRIIATHNGLAILHERHDEICREWESACERERAANHLLAEKTAECDTIRRDAQAATAREAVERALQAAWNDVCTDSGCHPDCFTRKGKRLVANFARGGTFTQLVAEYLNVSAGGAGSGPEEHGETVQSKCSCRERAVAVMDVERAWMNPPDDVNKNEYVYSAPDVRKLFDEILDAIDKGSQGRFPNLRAAFPISDEKERSEAMIALEGDSHVSAGGSARLIDEDRHGAPAHYNHDEVCAWIRGYNQAAAELLAASQGEAEQGREGVSADAVVQHGRAARARRLSAPAQGTGLMPDNQSPPLDPKVLAARITEYLALGGLFNPELMDSDRVRDMLIDCRDYLAALSSPEQGAEAVSVPQPTKMPSPDLHARLCDALQSAWNDYCDDAGCHPECFTSRRGKLFADFSLGGEFTRGVAARLERPAVSVPPEAEREALEKVLRDTETYKAMLAQDRYPANFGEQAKGVEGVVLPLGSTEAVTRLLRDLMAWSFGMGQAQPESSEMLSWHERAEATTAKLREHFAASQGEAEQGREGVRVEIEALADRVRGGIYADDRQTSRECGEALDALNALERIALARAPRREMGGV